MVVERERAVVLVADQALACFVPFENP